MSNFDLDYARLASISALAASAAACIRGLGRRARPLPIREPLTLGERLAAHGYLTRPGARAGTRDLIGAVSGEPIAVMSASEAIDLLLWLEAR